MSRSPRLPRLVWFACVLPPMIAASAIGTSHAAAIRVVGDGRELGETPLLLEWKTPLDPGVYQLRNREDGSSIPAQAFRDRGKTYLGLILDHVPARGPLVFDGPIAGTAGDGDSVELVQHGARVDVRIGGKALTTYVPDDGPKPYYFPLVGPAGSAVTRAFPMQKVEGEKYDHPHHRSLWFTHGSVNKVDFWSELAGHGTIKETARPTLISGPVVGLLRTTDDWIGPDGKKVCEDERATWIYATKAARILDFEVVIKATTGPLTFGDTKEGMFGVRVATSMDVTSNLGGKILNAEGVADKAAWGKASPWVDYSGPVAGKTAGVAILNHPESFRYPTTWHVRDYGLFAANPFGWHDFGMKESGEHTIPAGGSLRFRYRVILHAGEAASAHLDAAFQGYSRPPAVMIE